MIHLLRKRDRRTSALIRLLAAFSSIILWASLAHSLAIPELKGRVTDLASMLRPSTIQQLEASLASLEQSDSTQLGVLTIAGLEGESLEDFSLDVVEKWQLGLEGMDNGALLLIAKADRKIRIEVGYGLEGVLTDLISGRIIRDIITPQFKNGNFDQGVIDGIAAMTSVVKGEFRPSAKSNDNSDEDFGSFIAIFIFLVISVGKVLRKRKTAAGLMGAVAAPVLSFFFMGYNPARLLFFIPFGFVAGTIASAVFGGASGSGTRRLRQSKGQSGFGGGFGSGGFGGGSSGGFSGGGGGFGGGGASGGW